ncbi:hypothetical protein ElyMa_004038200 [Elysia marginata]|uniref:Secreted protein n=1 Tax=Elysia marginata TaxID=1093978 RepID=A0AAV4G560_9GAST|nr:hypothetical protein ElyMa_004038200 [Elysia marginata]
MVARERQSATTFALPLICLMSVENSEMCARCLCWRAVHGSDNFDIAPTRGLWSVNMAKRLPSKSITGEGNRRAVCRVSQHGGVNQGCFAR